MKSNYYASGALVLLILSASAQAGTIVSSTANAQTAFGVVNASDATVSINARKDLAAGSVPAGFRLATWSASVTAGTLAFRVNRTTNPANPDSTNNWGMGLSKDTSVANSTNTMKFLVNIPGNTLFSATALTGWLVAAQGSTSVSSMPIVTSSAQALAAGVYPIALDVAAYAY